MLNITFTLKFTVKRNGNSTTENTPTQNFLRTMWSPEMHHSLYLFPRLSPNYRQSQVSLENFDIAKFPEFSWENSYEVLYKFVVLSNKNIKKVILEEGDVLYLPPFWFHRVESYEGRGNDPLVVAVNFWSDSVDQSVMKYVYTDMFYLPFVNSEVLRKMLAIILIIVRIKFSLSFKCLIELV